MKTAIVTGGSRGIGNAIVRSLAAGDVYTVFTYKSGVEEAAALQEELNSQGRQVLAVQLDITDTEACRRFVNDFYKEQGAPDILVNNRRDHPGRSPVCHEEGTMAAGRRHQPERRFQHYADSCVPHDEDEKRPDRQPFSSISGINGIKGQCNYSATKAALIGFTKALAKEASPLGIAVNAVAPGGVATAMTEALRPQAYEDMVRDIPMKRLCTAEEVAEVVTWLALESPLYLTGSTIVLDGGLGSL